MKSCGKNPIKKMEAAMTDVKFKRRRYHKAGHKEKALAVPPLISTIGGNT
jgi:hypothetical protein